MSYRDERDALRAENAELETALSEAQDEIERLRGEHGNSRGAPPSAWLGGPTRIQLERELDGELDESDIEELVGDMRSRFGSAGRIERLGRTVSWYSNTDPRGGRNVAVHFTQRDGRTRIRIEESIKHLAGGLFGGIVGGAGGAGSVNLLVWGVITGNVLLFLGAVGWLTLVFLIVRAAYASLAQRRARGLERFATHLEDRARGSLTKKTRKKARVAAEAPEEDDLNADELDGVDDRKGARRS